MRITIAFIVGLLVLPMAALAQLAERPGNSTDDPIENPRDLSGLSVKNPRVRVVHTKDPRKAGGSMYLQQVDPWLGYQWGRNLTQREFREMDGVYGDAGKIDGIILPDGATKMMTRGHVNSCAICHNTPYRDGGAGATIAKNGGEGRNTPHMFGAGLLEMIGIQIRLQALAIADANHDGWISAEEAKGKRCILANLPDGVNGERFEIDLGSFEENPKTHRPALNPLLNPIFVDAKGKRIAWASSLQTEGVAGYTFEAQIFGFGHLFAPWRPPVSTTLRSFIATPFDIHMGMQAFDPTTLNDPDGDGFSQISNAGALQCLTAAGKDRGAHRGPTGISLDDPDRDGYCEEISEGELDVAEWYLLNHPAPARGKLTDDVKRGEKLFAQIRCSGCHVPDWHLAGGDRRFFDLEVGWNDQTERLEGKLNLLASAPHDAFTVRGVYSDFKYHDLGGDFSQMQYDGSMVKLWRTSPLWGVGSTAPYGHDGASLSLDDVIRRHGGEALESRKAYSSLNSSDRNAVLAFLGSLVLYQTDRLPCDIDGDGKISEHFMVAGMDTGLERFNPEWLFKTPGRIEGPITNVRGEKVTSFALTNVRAAYGLDLEYLKDSDHDGFPDIIDPAPSIPGFLDGVHSPKAIWHGQLRL
jgi:hypothetical protein